jgi:hypothetical protein
LIHRQATALDPSFTAMPFTVSCAACDSRFLLGDDLFRRKVSGKVVTVRCRKCNAEISVDATEPATLPSQEEPPRRPRPSPPRPKQSATGTPLPATGTPLPAAGTPLPLPRQAPSATVTPLPTDALLSIWDAADKNVDAPRKAPPPRPHAPTRAQANEAEFIDDIEEAPPSSSDAPSLTTLTHESNPKKPTAPRKKPPDDFLVNLSAGTGGILGAPTIDVLGFASPPPPEVEELLEIEATELTPRAGTLPLFDMSAVLPVASGATKASSSSLSPSHIDLSIDVEMPQTSSEGGKSRERKYVVAPKTPAEAPARKTRRAGAVVWFALAAAASVLLVVGLRDHASSHRNAPEPAEHPPSIAETSPTDTAAPTLPATVATEVAPAPIAVDTVSTGKPSSSPSPNAVATSVSVKSTDAPKAALPDQPKAEAAPALEKPVEIQKPIAPKIEPRPEPADPGTEFDRASAIAALKAAAAEAAACRKDGDPSGTASLTITFAPSGRVTSANIQGPPFAGTPTGGCIANAMRHAHVPAFSGDRVTVNKTIVIQ